MTVEQVVNLLFLLVVLRAKPNKFFFAFVDNSLPFCFGVDLGLLVQVLFTAPNLEQKFSVLGFDFSVRFPKCDPNGDYGAESSDDR